jgi:hypothetical protein
LLKTCQPCINKRRVIDDFESLVGGLRLGKAAAQKVEPLLEPAGTRTGIKPGTDKTPKLDQQWH